MSSSLRLPCFETDKPWSESSLAYHARPISTSLRPSPASFPASTNSEGLAYVGRRHLQHIRDRRFERRKRCNQCVGALTSVSQANRRTSHRHQTKRDGAMLRRRTRFVAMEEPSLPTYRRSAHRRDHRGRDARQTLRSSVHRDELGTRLIHGRNTIMEKPIRVTSSRDRL